MLSGHLVNVTRFFYLGFYRVKPPWLLCTNFGQTSLFIQQEKLYYLT